MSYVTGGPIGCQGRIGCLEPIGVGNIADGCKRYYHYQRVLSNLYLTASTQAFLHTVRLFHASFPSSCHKVWLDPAQADCQAIPLQATKAKSTRVRIQKHRFHLKRCQGPRKKNTSNVEREKNIFCFIYIIICQVTRRIMSSSRRQLKWRGFPWTYMWLYTLRGACPGQQKNTPQNQTL